MSSDAIATAAAASQRSCASMKRSRRLALFRARRSCRPLRAPRREVLLHRCARPLESTVGGGDARLEEGSCLDCRPAEHVADDQRGALPRRQDLQCGEECELDRLALDDDRVGLVVARCDLVQQSVRVRLQPRHLGKGVKGRHLPGPAPDRVHADVGRDAVEPSAERLSREPLAAAPCPEERLLDRVLRLVERAEHPVAVDVQLAPMALGELGEPGLVGDHAAGFPCLTSWRTQLLPSGSLKSANEP